MSLSLYMSSPYSNILFVGPDYKNHRGGIGAVLSIYAKSITPFRFIPTKCYKGALNEMLFFAGAVFKLFFTLLRNREISIVHIHGAKEGSIWRKYVMMFIARKIYGKKIVFHIHAGGFNEYYERGGRIYKYMCRFVINNSDKLVVLSHLWDDFFYQNFKIKDLAVVVNPVEPKQIPATTPKNGSEVVFLFLGRIADHKGVFELIELVIKEQNSLRGKCKFLFGGDHEIERLKTRIAEGGISDMAEYIGWVENGTKERFFLMSDYFILPTHEEGMPMTILEAFSYGKPAITTPVGGVPEVVTNGKNGILFPPKDMEQLKKILFDVVNDKSKYNDMSKHAMNTANNYYPEGIKSKLEKIYSEIL